MVVAVDFDGTIVEHAYPKIGRAIPFAIETLLQLQKDGHTLLLWSVRERELLDEAEAYCLSKGLKFYAANRNYPEEERSSAARKLNADLFIDDRNVGGLPDWGIIYQAIVAMEKGETFFDKIRMCSNDNQRGMRKKRNFFIRLGEMFEKNA